MARTPRRKTETIEDATPLIPSIVADGVIQEVQTMAAGVGGETGAAIVSQLDDEEGRRSILVDLVRKADECFAGSPSFRKKIEGANGREVLYAFMRHWVSSHFMQTMGSQSRAVLTEDYANGNPPAERPMAPRP
jgi:hypothetical protein